MSLYTWDPGFIGPREGGLTEASEATLRGRLRRQQQLLDRWAALPWPDLMADQEPIVRRGMDAIRWELDRRLSRQRVVQRARAGLR